MLAYRAELARSHSILSENLKKVDFSILRLDDGSSFAVTNLRRQSDSQLARKEQEKTAMRLLTTGTDTSCQF